ncbi:Hypothetical predicted protein [Cloeon dipterum]|uniref:Uncharacterized protein n=1 Tax=Cloeon dipterum TaxID=197152 RepID=A0A8S1C608_9INSE|nr:Hypothetical predicted protein [Cloeon dipterum]
MRMVFSPALQPQHQHQQQSQSQSRGSVLARVSAGRRMPDIVAASNSLVDERACNKPKERCWQRHSDSESSDKAASFL